MKRFYKDERGSSLALTIIAMAFISLLAVAVISMTVTNIRLKIAQKSSQKNFYNTDSVMDEVRAGVEDLAAQATVDAYMAAFESYNASLTGSSVNLTDKYEKKFLEEMIESLSGGKRHYGDSGLLYKDEVLTNYLITNSSHNAAERYIPHTGAADKAPGIEIDGKSYGIMELENNTLLLKDVKVTMTEGSQNYKTTVTSDIRVTVPPMTADAYSEYLNYALIADNQIIADANSSVNGSMYAGTVRRFKAGAPDPEVGILVRNGSSLDVKANQVITRGDLLIKGGSKFLLAGLNGMNAALWAENIFTSGNAKNTMTLTDVICNVSDDMEIDGKDDEVTITGQYLGYNYNANYTDPDLDKVSGESQYSSAILINGMGANLDLSGLSKLVLSGKTFISKKTDASEVDLRSGAAQPIINPDIAMGESLSAKGAQIAYYVPSDFVTIQTGVTTAWDPSIDHNDTAQMKYTYRDPADSTTEYIFNYGGYLKYLYGLDPNTATDAELNAKMGTTFKLWDYLDAGLPLETYYRHNTAVEANAVTYFYLNFKNEVKMMEFYPQFKDEIPRYSTVKDTNAAYMGSTGIKINNGAGVFCLSGNVLYKDSASASDLSVKLGNESALLDSEALQTYAREKTQEYMSRQMALVDNYELASQTVAAGQYRLFNTDVNLSKAGTTDKTNLYNVLIDATKMAAKTSLEKRVNDSGTGVIVIEPRAGEEFVWNDSAQTSLGGLNKGIIIAAGNVKVMKDFSGLIIAGGDITLGSNNVKVSSDNKLLENMFTEDKDLATPFFYNLFSKYFQKVVNSAIGQEDDATQDVVFYERWKKE